MGMERRDSDEIKSKRESDYAACGDSALNRRRRCAFFTKVPADDDGPKESDAPPVFHSNTGVQSGVSEIADQLILL